MGNSIFDLTIDELDAMGRDAGRRAVEEAHAAGVPVPSMMRLRLPDGGITPVVVWTHPDGSIEFSNEGRRALLDISPLSESERLISLIRSSYRRTA